MPRRPFTESEIERLRADYRAYVESGRLSDLASEMGRQRSSLGLKAKELGLTDAAAARKRAAQISGEKARGTNVWASRPHPRGMAGKRHTAETRDKVGRASKAHWATVSTAERSALAESRLRSRVANQGSAVSNRPAGSWKAGWREIGGKRKYYRSRWEANYARYLEWLKQRGDIADWQHEPETFWFEKIKRGVRSYLPDFRVWEKDGSSALHEVKGWMDARSKTTLKRMAKYHPSEKIIVIRERSYKDIARKVGPLIAGWESGGRADRP